MNGPSGLSTYREQVKVSYVIVECRVISHHPKKVDEKILVIIASSLSSDHGFSSKIIKSYCPNLSHFQFLKMKFPGLKFYSFD